MSILRTVLLNYPPACSFIAAFTATLTEPRFVKEHLQGLQQLNASHYSMCACESIHVAHCLSEFVYLQPAVLSWPVNLRDPAIIQRWGSLASSQASWADWLMAAIIVVQLGDNGLV